MQTDDWRVSAYSFNHGVLNAGPDSHKQFNQKLMRNRLLVRLPDCHVGSVSKDNRCDGIGTALGSVYLKTLIVLKFPASIAIRGPPSCEVSDVFLGRRERNSGKCLG